jgi:hypothetical protein
VSLVVTPDATRAEVLESLAHLLAEAKGLSRRGKCGTLSQRYADLHANIDALVTELERLA